MTSPVLFACRAGGPRIIVTAHLPHRPPARLPGSRPRCRVAPPARPMMALISVGAAPRLPRFVLANVEPVRPDVALRAPRDTVIAASRPPDPKSARQGSSSRLAPRLPSGSQGPRSQAHQVRHARAGRPQCLTTVPVSRAPHRLPGANQVPDRRDFPAASGVIGPPRPALGPREPRPADAHRKRLPPAAPDVRV